MIWVVFAAMTGLAVLAILWPLARVRGSDALVSDDVAFYRAQVADIAQDRDRGLIAPGDAAAAEAEAGRRLLAADRAAGQTKPASPFARRAAALGGIVAIPVVALALYASIGHPDLRDAPLEARLHADPEHLDLAAAIAQIERHLVQAPDDVRGWTLLAPIYLRLGRADEAAHAYGEILRLGGRTPETLVAYGEALVSAAGGAVKPEARAVFQEAVAARPDLPAAGYYIGLAAAQEGDLAGARATWEALLAKAPPGAPWADAVRQRLATLDAPEGRPPGPSGDQAAAIAAMPADAQQQMIRSMVDGLAQRLQQNGRDADGWLRLVRAYAVLRETDKARTALGDARRQLASDGAALTRLDALASELGLSAS